MSEQKEVTKHEYSKMRKLLEAEYLEIIKRREYAGARAYDVRTWLCDYVEKNFIPKSDYDSLAQLLKEKEKIIEDAVVLLKDRDERIAELEQALSYLPKVPTQPYEKELAKLRGALRFYAYNEHWHGSIGLDECILRDSGAKARKALAKGSDNA